VIESVFNDEGHQDEDAKLRRFLARKRIKKKLKRKKTQSMFSRKKFWFNKDDHSWTVVGDYSSPLDKITTVARIRKKNPFYPNALTNNAVCDRMFLDFIFSKLCPLNHACELDQINKFYNGSGRAKLNVFYSPKDI
jgi:hypothetical protein